MATIGLQKFLNQLSKNKNVQSVVSEFNRLGHELAQKGHELNERWTEGKNQTLKQAQTQYHKAVQSVTATQKQLDREVASALLKIRRSASDVEKGLESYRKKAVAQKERIEKLIKAQAKGKKTAASSKKRAPKAKKAAKRVSKKTVRA
ncbi:MAG: hypothetical protein KF802_12515 [Bdellovibrionaceae bacterium]|nr:hypothetical protein [Pseudobdellovibrionaceae bacterium]MBX3034688.1 hypothetical protein [Pseudobdellovibrionaceae bacterium]